MKLKKIAISVMAGVMAMSNVLPSFAAETRQSQSSFDAGNNADVIVSIPQRIDLSYNSTDALYKNSDYVSAKGTTSAVEHLKISSDAEITYTNTSNNSDTVQGIVTFGTNGVNIWTSEQLHASLSVPDKRAIEIKVDAKDVNYADRYNSVVNFSIVKEIPETAESCFTVGPYSYYDESTGKDVQDNTKTVITGLTDEGKAQTSIVTPKSIDGKEVVEVDNPLYAEGVTSIYYNEGIKEIYNFDGDTSIANTSLTSVMLPKTLEFIGGDAFNNCTSLTKVEINEGNTVLCGISDGAFMNCPITILTLPDTVEYINGDAFNAYASTSFKIPAKLTDFAEAFGSSGNTTIKEVIIDSETFSLENSVELDALNKITITDNVKALSFASISLLASKSSTNGNSFTVTYGNNIENLGGGNNMSILYKGKTTAVLPASVKQLDRYCTLPETVTTLVIPYTGTDFVFNCGGDSVFDENFIANVTKLYLPKFAYPSGEYDLLFDSSYNYPALTDIYTQMSEAEWEALPFKDTETAMFATKTIHYNSTYTE